MFNQYYPMYQSKGLFAGLKKIGWGSILNNTQKTLNIVNQAIPIIYQVKPMVNNARTLFRVADAIKDTNTSMDGNSNSNNNNTTTIEKKTNSNKPQFYI